MHHPAGLLRALQHALGPHASPCRDALCCNEHWDPMHHPAGMHQALKHGLGPHALPCRDALCCNEHWDPMHHLAGLHQALQRALGPHASPCKVALSTATCIGTPCITLQGCSEHCNMHQDLMHHPAGLHQALQHAPGPRASPCRDAPSIATWTGTSCITLQGCSVLQ